MFVLLIGGPGYLLFYLILSVLTCLSIYFFRSQYEGSETPRLNLKDPYLIAYLRGQANETLRLAIIKLINLKLLEVNGTRLKTNTVIESEARLQTLEKEILRAFSLSGEVSEVFKNKALIQFCDQIYQPQLTRLGLLPDRATKAQRIKIFGLATVTLLIFGLGRILLSLLAGYSNVVLLAALTMIAIAFASVVAFPRLTIRGKNAIKDLQNIYRSSQINQFSEIMTPDMLMLTAVLGINILPTENYYYTQTLFPRAYNSSSGSCGSSCGSSCSSGGDGGSGCGSGCGGGGCGGD